MPYYDYKDDKGHVKTLNRPAENHPYEIELFCFDCNDKKMFKWQFPLSNWKWGSRKIGDHAQSILDGEGVIKR